MYLKQHMFPVEIQNINNYIIGAKNKRILIMLELFPQNIKINLMKLISFGEMVMIFTFEKFGMINMTNWLITIKNIKRQE